MSDILSIREMEQTAALVRRWLEGHGCSAAFGCTDTDVWLERGGRRYPYFCWPNWYRPGLVSREDWAAEIAYQLAVEHARMGEPA